MVNAEEAQETVELYAGKASACYNESNDYAVKISVKDFIQLSKFDLDLAYNEAVFNYVDKSGIHSSLPGLTITPSAGNVNISWNGTPVTIGDNVKTDILVLHFSVDGYPNNVGTEFSSELTWENAEFSYTLPTNPATFDAVNTIVATAGSLDVNVGLTDVQTAIAAETCFGGDATVTATAAGATLYLFNEDANTANWAWTTSPEYNAAAGETVTVRVKDASGCISLKKTITVPVTIQPVAFNVDKQDPQCFGYPGSVIITATGGTAPYKYYINSSASLTGATEKGNFQFSQMPNTYYVAVQDANGCANLADGNYWKQVVITDANAPITAVSTKIDVTCYGGNNGKVTTTVSPAGAYKFSINGGAWVADADEVHEFTGLVKGDYIVKVQNANGCEVAANTVTVDQPAAPISFEIAVVDVACGEADNGQIIVSNITGGTAPYDLKIKTGMVETPYLDALAAGYTFTGLKPAYYSLTVTDANGCVATYNNPNQTGNVIAVQSPESINFKLTTTQPNCHNEDAIITVSDVTGGSGVYEYSFNSTDGIDGTWSQTTTFTWAAPYNAVTVHVRNANGTCAVPQNAIAVVNPSALTASVSNIFPPTCIDGNDGNVYVNISGGTSPYQYSINGGSWKSATAYTAVKVMVGAYSIRIKDSKGCEFGPLTGTVNLQENVITASSNFINCFGTQTGTIAVTFSEWANGNGIGTGLIGTVPMRAVEYYVKNEAGQTTLFTPSNRATWNNPATTFMAGKYDVWVVDQYTCQSNVVKVEIKQNPELKISSVVANGASCFGTYEGTITVQAIGGTVNSKLKYAVVNNQGALDNIASWKYLPFDTYNSTTTLSSVSFQVDGGTYYISVKDEGCAVATYGPIVVDGYEQLLVNETMITKTNALCFNDANGSITVPMSAVSGGAGAYKFTLLNSVGAEITGRIDQPTGVFTGLVAGSYKVLVEDAKGCPSYTTANAIVVGQPAAPLEFTYTKKHISCYGANDGLITISATGGTKNYKFAVNNDNTWFAFDGANTTKQYVATEPGVFKIWVKDANGCVTGPEKILILEPAAVTATVKVDKNITCVDPVGGQVTVTAGGGWNAKAVSTFEYYLDDNTVANGSSVFTGLSLGEHSVTVKAVVTANDTTQLHGDCVKTVSFEITQPAPITYTVDIDDVKCKGGNDGALTVSVISGGTADEEDGYRVRLTGPGMDVWAWTGTDHKHTFTGLSHAMYTVRIIDAASCELAATAGDKVSPYTTVESWEVQEPETVLSLSASWINNVSCFGGNNGSFSVKAEGGSAPYKFFTAKSILPNHILVPDPASDKWIAATGDTYTKTDATAATWIVWVMDANGCIKGGDLVPVNEYRVQILEPAAVTFNSTTAAIVAVQPKCNGGSDGSLTVSGITGGTAPYTVVATSSTGVYTSAAANSSTLTVSGISAGTYSVKVVDSRGCESTTVTNKVVGQPALLTLTLAKGDDSFTCPDAVEGMIQATAVGGKTPYTYSLYKNGVLHTADVSPSAFLVQIGNTFKVVVKDANGCTAEATIQINPVAPIEATVLETTCYGDANASVKVVATGEAGRTFSVRYRINTTLTFSAWEDFDREIAINNLVFANATAQQNFYYFQVKDSKGCVIEFEKSFVPTQHPLEVSALLANDNTSASMAITGGISPYSYQVGSGEIVNLPANGNTFQVIKLKAPSTTVTVFDAHGCFVTKTLNVAPVAVVAETEKENNFANKFDVELTFNRPVTVAAGDIVGGTYTPGTGTEFIVAMSGADLATVKLELKNTIADASGNKFAGAIYEYVIGDNTAPVLASKTPTMDVTLTNNHPLFKMTFNEDVKLGEGGKLKVYKVGTTTSPFEIPVTAAMINGKEVTVTYTTAAGLDKNTNYYVTVDGSAITDIAGNKYAGISDPAAWTFKTGNAFATGNEGLVKASDFKVYPNPFAEYVNVANASELSKIVVTNIAGQVVKEVVNPSQRIQLNELRAGAYFISLYDENDVIITTAKIIKR